MTPRRLLLTMCALAVVAARCGSSTPATAPPAPAGKKVDPATVGTITGRITFEGTAPKPELLKMSTDPACVQDAGPNPQSDAVLVAKDGAVQNVFVYLKEGLDQAYTFDAPAATVVLNQKGCMYQPRILGVQVGQTIELLNDDPTFHNVHALPAKNQEFNQSMNTKGAKLTRTFSVPEVMVRFKCDVHGWMAAYVGVLPHPFFAVTGPDGTFDLKGVPPGTYTVEAWHERFGTRSGQVTVSAGQPATLAFSFTGA